MATKQSALAALKAHLPKPVYSEQLSSLDSVRKFVENNYPRLQVEDVHISDDPEADGSRWVIVCTTKFSDIGDGSGQVKPARMVELELATQIFARSKRGNISDVRLQYSTAIIIFSTKFRLCPHHRRIWKLHALTLLRAGKFYLCALDWAYCLILTVLKLELLILQGGLKSFQGGGGGGGANANRVDHL